MVKYNNLGGGGRRAYNRHFMVILTAVYDAFVGAHMNPAVTLAFAVVRRLPWKKVPVYWAAQMLGAFVASACVYGVYYGV